MTEKQEEQQKEMLIANTPWMHTAIHTLRLLIPTRRDVRFTAKKYMFHFRVFVVNGKGFSFGKADIERKAREKLSGTDCAGEEGDEGDTSGDDGGGFLGST